MGLMAMNGVLMFNDNVPKMKNEIEMDYMSCLKNDKKALAKDSWKMTAFPFIFWIMQTVLCSFCPCHVSYKRAKIEKDKLDV
jgi:hypothetical protein